MEEQLTEPLADLLAEVAAANRAELRRMDTLALARATAATAPARRRPRAWLAVPALIACAGAATVIVMTSRPAPLAFSTPATGFVSVPGRVLEAAADAAMPVDFTDGSHVALAPGARLTVEALASAGATLALEHGRAEVRVTHRESTRWVVKAGPARVAVTGTRFGVAWDPAAEELTVDLREGSVVVSDAPGATGPERLHAGQTLRASRRRGSFEILETRVEESATASPVTAPAERPRAPDVTGSAASRGRARSDAASPSLTSVRGLAAKARYGEALRAAERAGFEAACETASSDDLVLLGDVARLAGAPDRAEQAYRAARRRFPGADRSAFALGVTEFDQRRRYAEAATWFETYLRQYPAGPLAREAAGRLIEARQRDGDLAAARDAARAYVARYPSGPHAALARQLLSP